MATPIANHGNSNCRPWKLQLPELETPIANHEKTHEKINHGNSNCPSWKLELPGLETDMPYYCNYY